MTEDNDLCRDGGKHDFVMDAEAVLHYCCQKCGVVAVVTAERCKPTVIGGSGAWTPLFAANN